LAVASVPAAVAPDPSGQSGLGAVSLQTSVLPAPIRGLSPHWMENSVPATVVDEVTGMAADLGG
jgi:hypothetical protein